MPKFTFECHACLVEFSRTLKMGLHETHPCPECDDPAPRIFEGFGFGFADSTTASPGNTGVSKNDYPTADQAVGSSADKRWEILQEREKVKSAVRSTSGERTLIRRNGQNYVEYEAGSQNLVEGRKSLVRKVNALYSERDKARDKARQ